MVYENSKLFIRPLQREDIEKGNYKKWGFDNEVNKYNTHGIFPQTEKELQEFINKSLNSKDNIVWAIFAKKDCFDERRKIQSPIYIGNIALQEINLISRSAELAILIGEKQYWGLEYGSDSCKFILQHGFNKLGLHRIWLGTASTNIGMQKIAEKIGMHKEGTFKDGTFLNGKFEDIYYYSILKEDYKA